MINEPRLVQTFLDLVQIDSPSGDENAIAQEVAARLRTLGAKATVDELFNVSAFLPGKSSAKPFFLNAHTDNVAPARGIRPIVSGGIISSDGNTVLGADDLAGVAAILEAVESLQEDTIPHPPLEFAITAQEEMGLVGAKGLDLTPFSAKEGIVLDSSGPVGTITLSAPTHNLLEITITGKAAHSARPSGSINALTIAAHAVANARVGEIDRETTANFGIIRGGNARNIVPERVELVGEVRSRNLKKLERQTAAIKKAFDKAVKGTGAKLDFRVTRAYNRYELKKSDRLVKRVAAALTKIGRKPNYRLSMGGSDANVWNSKGIKTVVVSVGYEEIHTTAEFIPIIELVKTAELVETLIAASA